MTWFERHTGKPVNYVLQTKTRGHFTDVQTYDVNEFPIRPTLSTVAEEIDEHDNPDGYFRIIARYKSGNIVQLDEKKATRKRGGGDGLNFSQLERELDRTVKPLKDFYGFLANVEKSLAFLRGTGGLTREDVAEVFEEKMGMAEGGEFWSNVAAPGWVWIFHPAFRKSQRETLKDIEDLVVNVAERVTKKVLAVPTAEETGVEMPSLKDIMAEAIAKEANEHPAEKTPPAEPTKPDGEPTTEGDDA